MAKRARKKKAKADPPLAPPPSSEVQSESAPYKHLINPIDQPPIDPDAAAAGDAGESESATARSAVLDDILVENNGDPAQSAEESSPRNGAHSRQESAEAMISHARYMVECEREVYVSLTQRGKVIVAATSGLLGFVSVVLLVTTPASVLGMMATDRHPAEPWLTGGFVVASVILIAGLVRSIAAISAYVKNHDEERGMIDHPTSFGEVALDWYKTHPSIHTVSLLYLVDMALQERFYGSITQVPARLRCLFKVFLMIWEVDNASVKKRLKRTKATIAYLSFVASGGTWPRIRFTPEAHEQVRTQVVEWLLRANFERYRTPKEKLPHVFHYPKMATSATYYLQFAEGFAVDRLGVYGPQRKQAKAADRDGRIVDAGAPYRERAEPSPDSPPGMTQWGWRIFTSTYITAQRLRSSNWNLWWRVRSCERFFVHGITLITIAFGIAAGCTGMASYLNQPVTRLQLSTPTGEAAFRPQSGDLPENHTPHSDRSR